MPDRIAIESDPILAGLRSSRTRPEELTSYFRVGSRLNQFGITERAVHALERRVMGSRPSSTPTPYQAGLKW